MLQFLAPTFVIGLIGITIPILIHFWNTRDKRIIKVGSIRWIQESDSVKVRRFKLSEVFLMLVRIVIVILLVLLIADARSHFFKGKSIVKNWVLVDPSIDNLNEIEEYIENSENMEWETHWFEPNFSLIENQPASEAYLNFWQLLKILDLNEFKPDSILVISRSEGRNFGGVKPELSMVVDWVTISSHIEKNTPVLALLLTDSLLVYESKLEEGNLRLQLVDYNYKYEKENGIPYLQPKSVSGEKMVITKLDTLQIRIEGDINTDAFKNIRAAMKAVNAMSILPIGINKTLTPHIVINIEDSISYGSDLTFIFLVNQKSNGILSSSIDKPNVYYLTKNLSIDNMIKYDFVEGFCKVIIDSYNKEVIQQADFELPIKMVQPNLFNEKPSIIASEQLASLTNSLWILLVVLLALERIISYRKNQ